MNEKPFVKRRQFAYVCIEGEVFQDFSEDVVG